ncbi:DUF4283 domain-containing protein/zf-CCHC_4 domain-containing protein [Cephalotus follicularis]|uniref:DUF4283 domain-containing protein/zf-CCHC_4 domain-containing protein n=1 Tax=Cephalotus follicularis TaxID=3775 RepID=A0A1Q3CVF1_CEPFO|nr:DUF4283 domain-containing protein/zf-CCHC_4 domain-containing protein [Cephalotus follicularis]
MIDNIDPAGHFCLIRSLLRPKSFNKETLKKTMQSLWRGKYGLRIREVGNNMFLFMFNNNEDRMKVLKLGPWHFNKHILLLEKMEKETNLSQIELYKPSFWFGDFGVPYLFLLDRVGRIIGEAIGDLEEVEFVKGKKGSNQFIKLWIGIDVRSPLRRGMKFLIGSSKKTWLTFQYEKLPNFFYHCGRIGHTLRECEHLKEKDGWDKNADTQYGSWMTAESF